MMAHTTTPTTTPATTPATLEEESSLLVSALVTVGITVLVDIITMFVIEEPSLLVIGPVDVSLSKYTVTQKLYVYVHSEHSSTN